MLNRLRGHDAAAQSFDAVFDALGLDGAMRERLQEALLEMIPVKGDPPSRPARPCRWLPACSWGC